MGILLIQRSDCLVQILQELRELAVVEVDLRLELTLEIGEIDDSQHPFPFSTEFLAEVAPESL